MPKIAVSGGTGYVGRFIVDRLLAANFDVVLLGRTAPDRGLFEKDVEFCYVSLTEHPDSPNLFDGCAGFVHTAFHHEAGKYRGGEGNDPASFRRANLDGSVALFHAAKAAGVQRTVFLSSRAVYGPQTQGNQLAEDLTPRPDTLYGEVKLQAERALLDLSDPNYLPIVARSTGIYGTSTGSHMHKWAELFAAFERGETIRSRVGTEVQGVAGRQEVVVLCY